MIVTLLLHNKPSSVPRSFCGFTWTCEYPDNMACTWLVIYYSTKVCGVSMHYLIFDDMPTTRHAKSTAYTKNTLQDDITGSRLLTCGLHARFIPATPAF